ncbi:MAG: hypothetical protein Q4C67_01085 [Deinococcus sp.]|nr:hypothetical protein [Deinococcus sp.]
MGPALLPPAWSGMFSLALAGGLSLVLGGLIRRAAVPWGSLLLWLGWVLAAVQWGWAWGSQPSGLPYWLGGMVLGVLGAVLVRPDSPPHPDAVSAVRATEPVPAGAVQAGPGLDEAPEADATAAAWTAPLAPPPSAPVDESWTAPTTTPTTAPAQRSGRPVWAEEPAAQVPQPADVGWTVPLAGAAQSPARPQKAAAPPHWQNQTWWAPDDELADGPDRPLDIPDPFHGDWAEAEALLERESGQSRRTFSDPPGRRKPAYETTEIRRSRELGKAPELKEDIEDRE